ncbi:uncharacterized protein LOC123525858 isoform X3 [Mercenaria mercenaria]|uniref:uncharacterized protein LOC123525858 isoform X3 n=1 Tax=Mercenaria mercenaria TaxID=6596 RepID=UPI00234EAAA1|nr:uncharacterized protein LOC123525858 isoform X3 [Mercenaria mercenaria]
MRITQQLLRSKAAGPLQTVEYLDLSNLGLVSLERLNCCPKLQALNLRGNSIVEVSNLELNRNLWKLDLSNNQIKDLDCLSKFIALGTLNLANNDLTWHQIGKLRHLHILELSLHGNKQIEKDPYYRIHVIDCLPNVWMLDGRIITSAERLQVKHFFADSALTEHPIRRKLSKEWFVPSNLKKIEVNGVYGEKATHLMIRFPANGPCNVELDRRRLKYLSYNAQSDLILEKKYTKREFSVLKYRKTFIEDILDARYGDRERCNMLLLLLVATLEFVMPTHLVKETLEVAKLSKIGKVYSMDLFLLPKDIRCHIVCILLGAVKIDKDSKEDGGLYDKLYLCLFYTVAELSKLSNSIFGRNTAPKLKMTELYRDYKCLLASEIVQLLCIVPAFFEYIDKDVDMPGASGVVNLVVTATGDHMIKEKVSSLSQTIESSGGDVKKLYEELSDFLLQKVQEQSLNLTNKRQTLSAEDQVITATKSIPMKSARSPVDAADFHAKGITSPNLDPPTVLSARRQAEKNRKHFPRLGDFLLLGPQTLGKVIGLPQPFVAHVAMDSVPVANGAMESKLRESEDHYTYVNMDQFDFDLELNFWKPRGSIGDNMLQEFLAYSNVASSIRRRYPIIQPVTKGLLFSSVLPLMEPRHFIFRCKWFTIHTIEDLRKELNRRANLAADQVLRPNSPEETLHGHTNYPLTTPGRDTSTPLIFSPGGLNPMADEYTTKKTAFQPVEFTPRPMTSLLKEKLDLKLDLTTRRIQSAGPVERSRSSHSPHSPRNTPNSSPEKSKDVDHDVHGEESADCLHCALAASMAQEPGSEEAKTQDSGHECTTGTAEKEKQENSAKIEGADAVVEDNQKQQESIEANKENERPDTSRTVADSLVHSDEEPELQGLATCRTGRPASAPNVPPDTGRKSGETTARKTNSSLKINIPQVEIMEEDDKSARKGRAPVIKGRQPFIPTRAPLKTGKLSVQSRNRPFSAMDAYRYIVEHPRKNTSSDVFNTSYQQQRTEAWRQSAFTSASNPQTPRQGTPPPQRPTSPDQKSRPTSSFSVKKANDWLGGGRDLYWESIQKRPRSGHVPGWKEGLPDSMKRPRSAVAARTLNRQTRRSLPVTPSSLAHEAMMQGSRVGSPRWSHDPTQLPDMMDLSEYHPLYHQLGLPRRLGSYGTHEQPAQDMVYRLPPSPKTMSTVSAHGPVNMVCIYEDEETGTHTTEQDKLNTEPETHITTQITHSKDYNVDT